MFIIRFFKIIIYLFFGCLIFNVVKNWKGDIFLE